MPKRKTTNATIEVILLEADKHLGEKYEKVRVKPVFARNILLPRAKAVLATPVNINNYHQKMQSALKEIENKALSLKELFAKIQENGGLTITVKTNDEGGLYAKIDETDISKAIESEYSVHVEPHLFKMKKKIVELGTYTVPFLYKELKSEIQVSVKEEEKPKTKEHKEEVENTEATTTE